MAPASRRFAARMRGEMDAADRLRDENVTLRGAVSDLCRQVQQLGEAVRERDKRIVGLTQMIMQLRSGIGP